MILTEIKSKKEKLCIISIYSKERKKKLRKKMVELLIEIKKKKILIRCNFNLKLRKIEIEMIEGEIVRCSKDKIVKNRGRNCVEWL